MPRGEQILRHWRLLQVLQRRGVGLSLRELTDEFGVSERTVQRDFELLQEVGFPIEFEEDEFGKRYWRLPKDYLTTAPFILSLTEAISLHLAGHLFAPLAGTQFAQGLQALLAKIRSQIPARALDYFCELDEMFYVRRIGLTDYSRHAGVIEVLTEAARTAQTVDVSYQSLWRGDDYQTQFDPYGLVFFEGDLFAVGRSHRAEAIRVFKISRIGSATMTDEPFERPANFSLADYFQSSFGVVQASGEPVEIEVYFHGPAAALVEERIWHESQKLEWLPAEQTLFEPHADDTGPLRATFSLSNVVEFKRWLKGFGEMAEVTRPGWLRAEIRDDLLVAAERYRD